MNLVLTFIKLLRWYSSRSVAAFPLLLVCLCLNKLVSVEIRGKSLGFNQSEPSYLISRYLNSCFLYRGFHYESGVGRDRSTLVDCVINKC